MSHIPEISEAEWKVMAILWQRSPLPAFDIIELLRKKEDWHPNTIKTLLTRLHKKRAIKAEKYKNLYLYSPIVSREECVQVESETFLERVFGGAVKPMLVHFVSKKKLTQSEIEELKRILQEQGGKQ